MEQRKYPQFILFGDSIIQQSSYLRDGYSFAAVLEEHCSRRLDVINRGLSGYTTAHATRMVENLMLPPSCSKVDYLLVLFGANDSCLPGQAQHVPLSTYKQNITNILSHPSVRLHEPTIFLVTPPPIDEIQFEQNQFKDSREQANTAQYAEAIREIASELEGQKIILIDLWQALMKKAREWTPEHVDGGALIGTKAKEDNEGLRLLLSDGLHLSARGYQVFIEELLPKLGDNWDRQSDNEWIFPYWGNLPKAD